MIRAHVPVDARSWATATRSGRSPLRAAASRARRIATASCSSRTTSTAAPASCSAGRWTPTPGARRSQRALADPPGTGCVQERIPVRREVFPQFDAGGRGHDARHAGRLRAVPVPRPHVGLPDAPQRHRPGQRDIRRRPGARLRRQSLIPARQPVTARTELDTLLQMMFGPAPPDLLEPGAHNAVEYLSGHPAGRARGARRRRGEPRGGREPRSRRLPTPAPTARLRADRVGRRSGR